MFRTNVLNQKRENIRMSMCIIFKFTLCFFSDFELCNSFSLEEVLKQYKTKKEQQNRPFVTWHFDGVIGSTLIYYSFIYGHQICGNAISFRVFVLR